MDGDCDGTFNGVSAGIRTAVGKREGAELGTAEGI